MFGQIEVKVRPLRLAYLVDPHDVRQVRQAIQLSSTLWGGSTFPILALHKRMPATWKDKPFKRPEARQVMLGSIEAFDPDILVQLAVDVPAYVSELGIKTIKGDAVWEGLDRDHSPKYGLGIFELLKDIFDEHFKYKAKYPVRVVLPDIPTPLSLFWASVFGEIPPHIRSALERGKHFEALEIEAKDFQPEQFRDFLQGDVLFPRRLTLQGLRFSNRSGSWRDEHLFFLDATSVEDVVDYWNLRALGKRVIPVPTQLKEAPYLKEIVTEFLKECRRPWDHNPEHCDYASIIKGRSTSKEDVTEYASALKIAPPPNDRSKDPFFAVQLWFPRFWDEWARDKDGAVPADVYGEEENSIEVSEPKDLRFRFTPLLPKWAREYPRHMEARCANDVAFRFYGSDEYLAEVFPKTGGRQLSRAISGMMFRGEWRVGRSGLVRLVSSDITEPRDVPTAENVMFAWLADLGWKAEVSPPGLLAK